MKTLLTICALAAGAGLMATTETTEASHRCRGYGYGAGYRYTAPVFNGYPPRGYGINRFDRGYYSVRRPYRDFGRPYGYGNRGFGRSGFSLQTPGFGIYVR
jgi:hypothetical protein